MLSTVPGIKVKEAEECKRQLDEFLANGGIIQVFNRGESNKSTGKKPVKSNEEK